LTAVPSSFEEPWKKREKTRRSDLPDGDQRLLNAMYFAAMGKHPAQDEDVQ